uniref:Tetratricopeptide SHNi-TPR domain-containing protein n=1 Tax=Biomphalaria glabrata TaxID=6526 RepID=A0A2C9KHU1_BIOGL
MATESSTSAVDSVEKLEVMKKAADLLAQGKRNMLCGEVPKAVNLFEEAVQLLVKECGELSRDCADAYFSCGSALLELGRMETNVLGTALEGVEVEEEKEEEESEQFEKPPAEDDSVRQQLREEVYEAMAEGEREKDMQKTDKEIKDGEDGGASQMETVTDENKDNVADKSDLKESITAAGDADKELKKEEIPETNSTVEDKSLTESKINEVKPADSNTVADKDETKDQLEKPKQEEEMEVVEKNSEKSEISHKAHEDAAQSAEAEKETASENAVDTAMDIDEKKDVELEDESEADKDDEETEETVDEEEAVEGDESADGEKDEDVPNFQLAWEYLDLAKVIYLKNESKEDQLKAAECHLKLGEVSMETEQHTIAVEDLLSALKIQQKYLAPDDRLIAETHYQLGLAYGLGKEFKLSIEQYQLAISVIEAKIASLKKVLEDEQIDAENKENLETNPELKKFADEIKELQDLIPEMKNKTEDARIEENDLQKMKAIVKENLFPSGTTKEFGSPSKKSGGSVTSGDVDENGERKASDIAHLVRKKRKPEEDTSAPSEQEVKKIRQEVVSDDVNVETKVDDEAKMNVDEQVNTEESQVNSDNSNINVEPKVNGDEPKVNGDEPNVNGDEPKVNGDEPGVNGDDIKVSGDIIESKVISKVEVSPTEDAKMNGDTETPSIETSASTEVAPMAT